MNIVLYAILNELDNAVGIKVIKWQYSWFTSYSKSSVEIFELDCSLSTITSPLYTLRNLQLATQLEHSIGLPGS